MKQKTREGLVLPLLFAAVLLLAFSVMRCVPNLGDDYYYRSFTELSASEFWGLHLEHYMQANGRAIVHILVTLFMKMPNIVWQLFNSALIALIAVLSARLAAGKKNVMRLALTALVSGAAILSLRPDMTRESVYWLTGSFNYVYPFAVLLLYWYLLQNREIRARGYLLPIAAFFSAATTEQNSMMTLGVSVLYIFDLLVIRREKPLKSEVTALVLAVVGLVSVYFAPATFVRYGLETNEGFFVTLKKNLPVLYYQFMSKKYMTAFLVFNFSAMGLFLFGASYRCKRCPSLVRMTALLNVASIFCVTVLARQYSGVVEPSTAVYLLACGICFAANVICVFIIMLKYRFENYLVVCTAFILAFGSQLMMAGSPVFGPRTMLCGVLMLVIFDAALLAQTEKIFSSLSALLAAMLLINGVSVFAYTHKGYKANYEISEINEKIIFEAYHLSSVLPEELTLYKNKYSDCCWSMPYESSYHLYYFKQFYALDENTNIIWVDFEG